MLGPSVTLLRVFGFKVQINITWAVLALLIAWSLAQGLFPALYSGLPTVAYWWMAILSLIGLLFSIVAHELCHSLVARRFGAEIRGITLFVFGGVAEMEEEPTSPRMEFLVALAGPAMSLVLAVLFYAGAILAEGQGAPLPLVGILHYLGLLNFILAAFNMVPAFPLDGGRVLRAALWHWQGDLRRATRTAAWCGSAFGYALMAAGVYNALTGDLVGGIWWVLIGIFLNAAARGSLAQLEIRTVLEGEPVRRFMTRDPVTVPPDITIRELVEGYLYRHYHDVFPVVDEPGRLIGCVGLREIKAMPREEWDSVPVSDVLTPCSAENTIEADRDALRALAHMRRTGNGRLLVTERGRLAGMIALKDLLNLVALRLDLEGGAAGGKRRRLEVPQSRG